MPALCFDEKTVIGVSGNLDVLHNIKRMGEVAYCISLMYKVSTVIAMICILIADAPFERLLR
jgi:hypothetical protein